MKELQKKLLQMTGALNATFTRWKSLGNFVLLSNSVTSLFSCHKAVRSKRLNRAILQSIPQEIRDSADTVLISHY